MMALPGGAIAGNPLPRASSYPGLPYVYVHMVHVRGTRYTSSIDFVKKSV